MLTNHVEASEVCHVSGEPINKYELLLLFWKWLGPQIDVVAHDALRSDHRLDSTRLRGEFR